MAEPMILELLSNLKTRVATNETNIAKNASTITANKTILDNHMADDVRHWTTSDRQNFNRVVHFKGYFTTEAKLKEAYATGALGDYAIVGATDTVWLWDDTTSKWLNSTEQGIVISVNGRTGEVVLTKTDVGLSNVDNTSDKNKPVSTAQQTALNAKADRKKITISEADSLTLKAGIYDINNGSKTILGFTAAFWTVIVGENNGSKSAIQIWTNYNSDVAQHIYIRKQQSGSSWSEFKELATNTDISNLQTQITTNKNNIASNDTDIANLNNNKVDKKQVSLDELNGFGLKAGIYDLSGTAMTILGFTSKYWTIIVGEETGQSHKAAVQIWINYTSGEVIHMYIRRQQGNHASWSSFTEILTTSHLSTEQIALAKQYKGYYATADALTTAQKTGTAGDYAVVGENQVMFIWNTIENAWTSIINEQSIGSGAVTSVNGMVGAVTLTKSNVGLTNVDNTSDKNKPVSTAQQAALDKKVNKAGDTMTGELDITAVPSTGGQIRLYYGANTSKYGTIIRNDGDNTYILLTNGGSATGTWNSLRPFSINNSNGYVTIGNGLRSSSTTDSTSTTTGGLISSGGLGVAKAINAGTSITAGTYLKTGSGVVNFKDKVNIQYNSTDECIEFIFS